MTRRDSSLPSRSVYCESPLSSTGPPPRPSAWCCSHRPARSPRPARVRTRPLSLPADGGAKKVTTASGGGSLVRTFVGLAIVLAVIYGVAWVLKQVKRSKEDRGQGTSLETTAVVALGPNRSLHLVRAGRELVLVGVAEHGVTPIRTYSEDEAIDARPHRRGRRGPRRRAARARPPAPAPCAGWTASRTGRCGDEGARRHQRRPAPAARRRADAHPRAALLRHRLHAHHHRPGLHPPGHGHAERAAQPGARRHRPLPDDLRHGAHLHADQEGRHRPAAEAQDHPDAGLQPRPGAAARVHVPPDARRPIWPSS